MLIALDLICIIHYGNIMQVLARNRLTLIYDIFYLDTKTRKAEFDFDNNIVILTLRD